MKTIDVRLVVANGVEEKYLVRLLIEQDKTGRTYGAQILRNNGFGHMLPDGPKHSVDVMNAEIAHLLLNPKR